MRAIMTATKIQEQMNAEYRIHGESARWFSLREKLLAEVR